MTWQAPDFELIRHLLQSNRETLAAYRERPLLVYEHANIEQATSQGGYGRRQLYELIQNAADAVYEEAARTSRSGGKIHLVLAGGALYCANEGDPIDERGIDALLSSHISEKRGAEIGRFGLGFKSVLGVTTSPEFFSRSISFRFSGSWSRRTIQEGVPGVARNPDGRTPVLRLAQPLDPTVEASSDSTLRELMAWASTVVRLPLDGSEARWLAEDLVAFPAEFLLFAPHVSHVRLEDRGRLYARTIELNDHGTARTLRDSAAPSESEWRIFEVPSYRPSDEAKRDAGERAKRDEVPLVWAVPVRGQSTRARGQFWAFFPTEYETTLKGILNAPWKTNEDRQNLLRGTFNEELIEQFAQLVVVNLPNLVDDSDPGAFLELLPARGREAPSWADELITHAVYRHAATGPALPDQAGVLRRPGEIQLHPRQVTAEALEAWTSHPGRPLDWCHHTIVGDTRYARAHRLLSTVSRSPATFVSWLEAVARDESVSASSAAVRAAGIVVRDDMRLRREIASAYFVLTSDEELAQPDPSSLFISSGYAASSESMYFVHPDLLADQKALWALESLGIEEADLLGELRAILRRGLGPRTDWDRLWSVAAGLEPEVAFRAFASVAPPRHTWARTRSNEWRPIVLLLLPGEIIPEDSEADLVSVVDTVFHEGSLDLLRLLGLSDRPTALGGAVDEPWFEGYRKEMLLRYDEELERGQNPHRHLIKFDRDRFAGPLENLEALSPGANARLTEAVLDLEGGNPWVLRHSTQGRYPVLECPPPTIWRLKREGLLQTTLGPTPPESAVGRSLTPWKDFFPVLVRAKQAISLFGLPDSAEELTSEHWKDALQRALPGNQSATVELGAFYAFAASYAPAPEVIWAHMGDAFVQVAPRAATVVTDRHEFDALREDSVPLVWVVHNTEADRLVSAWGLQPSTAKVSTEVEPAPNGAAVPVGDRYPDFRLMLEPEDAEVLLQPCESIQQFVLTGRGRTSDELDYHFDSQHRVLFYRDSLEETQVLGIFAEKIGVQMVPAEFEAVVEGRQTAERMARAQAVRTLETDAQRLLALVGPDVLRRHLPVSLLETVESEFRTLDDDLIAQLFLSTYGISALKALTSDLADAGWPAPSTWAGSRPARSFVRQLGFDVAYAGRAGQRREPLVTVHGPVTVPRMHAFQRRIADAAVRLLRMEGGNRALLSLPTGAGKTRVAVESVVESVISGHVVGPILWVAQTDELCEQAVQTWAYLWRGLGADHELQISRLWASNQAGPFEEGVQVVVATIAKLDSVLRDDQYAWLRGTDCLVVDEAHAATTPSYTRLLQAVGLQDDRRRFPIIGLTATPFRGTSEVETDRLVKRFGGRRLDEGVFTMDPYAFLQDLGALAKVDHRILTGSVVELTTDELAELERTRRLPSNVTERIGADRTRNLTLLDSIRDLPEDWPVLLFAASVDHAQTMAALLTLLGIPAAAVSAQTEAGARRHYIEAFRRGDLRVLTNYGVLTQGFDAPATRAVYVARPTFSPNVYQQMVGRGLRGPLNGGKERCLIVNVDDTFRQFGERLAFTEFEYLWNRAP